MSDTSCLKMYRMLTAKQIRWGVVFGDWKEKERDKKKFEEWAVLPDGRM